MSEWVRALEWCLKNPGVPKILQRVAEKRAAPILNRRARPKSKPPIKFPKGKDPAKAKKALHAECEALCKALVFWRDCGDWHIREGLCVTCGRHATLQWGHFIEREKAVGLRYSVVATAGQCRQCNGPGKGMPWEFAEAIDKRDGAGAAAVLRMNYTKKHHVWNKATLTAKREELIRLCTEKRIPVDQVLKTPTGEAPEGASPEGPK
jgi:hypothetical protein